MTPEPEPEPPASLLEGQVRERLWAVANVVAPTTVVTTLLFYFGYVATTARFRYFGVYLDMVDLSLQEMLLYGVEVVYPPLTIVAIAFLLITAAHTGVRWMMASPDRDAVTGWVGLFVVIAGLLAFTRGIVGLLVPEVARTEGIARTPLSLGCGALALAYGLWLLRVVAVRWDRRRAERDDSGGTGAPDEEPAAAPPTVPANAGELATWLESPAVTRLNRHALAWVAVIVVAGSFWTANSFAAAYGRGRALDDAESLPNRPEAVLYTKEPLRDLPAAVQETELPDADDKESLRFRYRGLRLLVESNARLFLVPAQWVTGDSRTFVIPYDDSVRVDLVPRRR
ncbi:hypothetical protein QQY66_28815 [Streptomyces sp. DG2A-72]|uniref:hypothetical protein n=1 Tax=Streptomyces sp. DG2A-72 TaxID=3051386 RepID=UPI00265C8970|nr:hypothetical protein [Streptomyces sp. DG2A-72]MDO0935477.1 hypothetical protein [Streptomyces sp. DG2A-72]